MLAYKREKQLKIIISLRKSIGGYYNIILKSQNKAFAPMAFRPLDRPCQDTFDRKSTQPERSEHLNAFKNIKDK